MKSRYNIFYLLIAFAMILTACEDDLNSGPIDDNIQTPNVALSTPEGYMQLLAKCYAGFSTSGQNGPTGAGDVAGVDEGYSGYIRSMFNLQELPTEESLCAWDDQTIKDFHVHQWTASDPFITAFYGRIYIQIAICNEFIRQAEGKDEYKVEAAEARFIRALCYWHALDYFGGNVPFITEKDLPGSFFPEATTAEDLFTYIETELKAIESIMVEPQAHNASNYGRADRAAAWMVLAKLYLNAKTYIGIEKNTECITYCNKVMGGGYSLNGKYEELFLADNDTRTNEIIFAIRFDGEKTKSYNGTSFLANASTKAGMENVTYSGTWSGYTATRALFDKFEAGDKRGNSNFQTNADLTILRNTNKDVMFYTDGQTLDIEKIAGFDKNGVAVMKYKNITSTGATASSNEWSDVDFPMFRLADAYLMYAEAVKRGGTGGTEAQAIAYLNLIRERAYGDNSGDISSYNLDYILDERARELYWECQRRTDLIRFNKFATADYLWPWKAGVKDGAAFSSHMRIYPIPQSDITANINLTQNTDY